MKLQLVPVTITEAKAFVGREHRHHAPPVGHRFSVGVADEQGVLRGVAVAGRPKARGYRRAGIAMGYDPRRIITYTLASEPGRSLHAAGWIRDGQTKGESWDRAARPRVDKHPTEVKIRWRAAA